MHEPDDDARDPASDAALFRAAIGPVRRLAETPPAPRAPRRKAAAARRLADEAAALAQSRRVDPQALALALGEVVRFRRASVAPEVLRRLHDGQFAIEEEIDLHGHDAHSGEEALRSFLAQARHAGARCVCVVHGRGLHSRHAPVLKDMVERVLRQRADVLAYATAPATRGGFGAVLVLLARHRAG